MEDGWWCCLLESMRQNLCVLSFVYLLSSASSWHLSFLGHRCCCSWWFEICEWNGTGMDGWHGSRVVCSINDSGTMFLRFYCHRELLLFGWVVRFNQKHRQKKCSFHLESNGAYVSNSEVVRFFLTIARREFLTVFITRSGRTGGTIWTGRRHTMWNGRFSLGRSRSKFKEMMGRRLFRCQVL